MRMWSSVSERKDSECEFCLYPSVSYSTGSPVVQSKQGMDELGEAVDSLTVNRKSIATSSIDLQQCRPAIQHSKRERERERKVGKQESKLDEQTSKSR